MEFGPKTTWDLKLALALIGGLSVATGWTKFVDATYVAWAKDILVLSSIALTFMVTGTARPAATPTDTGRAPR